MSSPLKDERLTLATQAIIAQYGTDAGLYAAQQADEALENGNMQEHVMWTLILKVIDQLESEADGQTVH